jgi:hypothetical protein
MSPKTGRKGGEITDLHQRMQGVSALFRLVLRFLLGFTQRHRLLKRLTHFIQTLFIKVMNPLGAFGIEINQLVVLAHGAQYIVWQGCHNNAVSRQR